MPRSKHTLSLAVIPFLGMISTTTHADALLWSKTEALLLYGDNYKVDAPLQTTLTLEHVSGWSFGDVFTFIDFTKYNGSAQASSYYGEISPRLSLSKLSGKSFASGPISDVLLTATYEYGKGDVEGVLIGSGVDLSVPGFNFLQVGLQRRFTSGDRDGEVWQLTPAWNMSLGQSGLTFEGYIDWNLNNDGNFKNNLHFNPRLRYDLGQALGQSKETLYVGVEYSYWRNKFGIQDTPGFDTNQNTVSGFVSVRF